MRRERSKRREKKRIKKSSIASDFSFFFTKFLANGKADEATFLLYGVLVHPILMFL